METYMTQGTQYRTLGIIGQTMGPCEHRSQANIEVTTKIGTNPFLSNHAKDQIEYYPNSLFMIKYGFVDL